MKPKIQTKPLERIVPPKFKNIIEADFILRPTRMERWKIFLGYAINLKYLGRTEHSPGRMDHNLNHEVVNKF